MSRKAISEVFTPRARELNPAMYVARPRLEKDLARAFARHSHTLLFGESGNGKTWLFKVALAKNNLPYVVANCANASRNKSITEEICGAITEPGTASKLGYSEEKAAEVNAAVLKGGLKHTDSYTVAQEDPLLKAFRLFADSGATGRAQKKIIVLDNLESIFDTPERMSELADLIILLDDSRYSQCNINFLIVGVPNGVLQYFRETKNSDSVANRIFEIRKVEGLDSGQVQEVIRKGFAQLDIVLTGPQYMEVADHIWSVTLGIAQRVHEYCEALAHEIEDNNWIYDTKLLERADEEWLLSGLRSCYTAIEGHLNSRDTTVARRNQAIYCIGRISSHQFDANDIDKRIRIEFPSTAVKHMGIGNILSDLAAGDSPLLTRNDQSGAYSVRDPMYLMCIKLMLKKDPAKSKVIKKNFVR